MRSKEKFLIIGLFLGAICGALRVDKAVGLEAVVELGQLAFGAGDGDLIGDNGLRYEVANGTCSGGVPCPRPRFSIGNVTSPQSPLGIASDPINGLIETNFAPTGSWQRSINGWTINGKTASTPLTPHFNLGNFTRGFEFQESVASAPGAFPLLKLRGTADSRTAPILDMRVAPNQSGHALRLYSGAQLANGVDTGPKTDVFAVTAGGALYLGTTEPPTPPSGLVAVYGCGTTLCVKDASGVVTELY